MARRFKHTILLVLVEQLNHSAIAASMSRQPQKSAQYSEIFFLSEFVRKKLSAFSFFDG